jgi:hypothetical protein
MPKTHKHFTPNSFTRKISKMSKSIESEPKRNLDGRFTSKRGLGSPKIDQETIDRVTQLGGLSKHDKRGLQLVSKKRRKEISAMGLKKRWGKGARIRGR